MKKIFLIFSFLLLTAQIETDQNIAPEPATINEKKTSLIAEKHILVAGHPLAVEAGNEILAKGGSAIDAAIAVQMVLNVVEPHASGIGGGGFLLYYDANKKKSLYFDGRETAPEIVDEKIFLNEDGTAREFFDVVRGGLSVGTPGVLKMLKMAHDVYGKLSWEELFAPAIKIASEGWEISERGEKLANHVKHLAEFSGSSKMFLTRDGSAKPKGEILKNKQLAKTFKIISKDVDEFYKGDIARDIVDVVANTKVNPGLLTVKDLKTYKVAVGDLLCGPYKKYKICAMPMPSSGGLAILQILGILEHFDLEQMEPFSAEAIHVISEAMRLVYADRAEFAADDRFVEVPYELLLDKEYLKLRSYKINIDATMIDVEPGEFSVINKTPPFTFPKNKQIEPDSTTHVSIIDSYGNAVSFTSSIEYSFGSGLMVRGFLLNNQLTDFSFRPYIDNVIVANRVQPLKKPRSSMAPMFIFNEDDELEMVLGSPGGARIIPYILKNIIAVLDWGMNINDAVASPNFAKMYDVLELEENTKIADQYEQLQKRGNELKIRDLTSGVNAIHIKDGKYHGGVDPRREGKAQGL
jgi:gamma-glutamyltranspeptidase / glutathione hydrolase